LVVTYPSKPQTNKQLTSTFESTEDN
jgi:hypothetical protein